MSYWLVEILCGLRDKRYLINISYFYSIKVCILIGTKLSCKKEILQKRIKIINEKENSFLEIILFLEPIKISPEEPRTLQIVTWMVLKV